MDEQNLEVMEEVETAGEFNSEISDEEFDALWDNDSDTDDFEVETSDEEADQQTQTEETTETEPTEENTETEDADQYLELKHFDEVRKVTKEEAKALAQKGMDYDRIRGKLAEAESNTAKLKKYEEFLSGMKGDFATVDDLIDDVHARVVMESEGISYENAISRVKNAQATPQAQAVDIDEAIRQKSLDTFLQLYPDVPAKDIPQEVWDDFRVTNNLVASYARYQSKTSAKENETLKQNLKNKNRSTGSMNSSGKQGYADEFDRMWYEDDY